MKKTLLLVVMCSFCVSIVSAQTNRFWTKNYASASSLVKEKAVSRQSFPKDFDLFDLNLPALKQELFTVVGNSSRHTTFISLPNAQGNLERFEVNEASNFDPALQARFPQIRAFSGRGITDPTATLKMSISPQGIQTMVFRTHTENEFIEPFSSDHRVYAVYASQRVKGSLPWTCTTEDQQMFNANNARITESNFTTSNAGELKTMRLAQSCNGEYATYFGAAQTNTTIADTAIVLAAFNNTLTRCNGIYEKDLALHLNLISETGKVIYFNPATDPYTTLANWNLQLQGALTANVGDNNYDIGHMFGASGGGGNAGCIGCVCVSPTSSVPRGKGSGITSPADGVPMGDNFDIDYVAHEVGHQLGGNHTFSHSNEGSGVNKEVGSGITIMGYAGITNQNVAPHSIDIFHETSIQQIQVNLAGKTCPITTNITATNATPVIAPLVNRIIPISTPFYLTGTATDANPADVLTYTWEQDDNGTGFTGNNSVAFPTKLGGPNWLTFKGTTDPTRIMPRLSTILAGLNVTPVLPGGSAVANIEALSSVARILNFRLTVRDNHPYSSTAPIAVGQTAFQDMSVTVSATSGPFQVTSPNTNVSWFAGSTQTITWAVNNTTLPPVSCANVKISLSTDGGQTFPTVLIASTPNDGTEDLVIPGPVSTQARIKVEAVGNIFFDISNSNFTIAVPPNGFTFGTPAPITVACASATPATTTLTTAVIGTFSTPIVLTSTVVPAGPVVTFTPGTINPGASTTVTVTNASTLAFGTYNITVTGTAGAVVQNANITLTVSPGTAPVITTSPANQSACAGSTVTFSTIATGATSYQWQVSTNGGVLYTNIAGATSASYTTAATTAAMNSNLYRVIVTGQCGLTTSNAATLTVNTAPAITTQPTTQTVCAGTNATYTVAATGSALTYQWQISTNGGVLFTDITGATASSYTANAVTVAQNGNQYRVVVSGTCPSAVTSNAATLNVGDAAAITGQPAAQTVCSPNTATFTATASGSSLTYQWQVSTDGGTSFTDVAGATAATYTTATTPAMNGNIYRVRVFSCTPTGITSNNALLTVNTPVAISAQPANSTVCQGTSTTFAATATGTGLTYQWQYSATGCTGTFTNIAGATAATYTIASPVTANNGGYRVVVTGTCNTVTSDCVTLTVNTPIVITTPPQAQGVCIPNVNSATFSVAVTGTAPTYQWQVSTNGGTSFTNIAGATAATYTVTPLSASQNGNQYRVIVSGTCTTAGVTSAAATLTVNTQVAIVAQPTSVATCTEENATFTVGATGSTITYQWQVSVNGGPFINLTNTAPYSGVNTATLSVSNLTTSLSNNVYRVVVSGVPCGSINSNPATLVVNPKPTVVLTASSFTSITPSVRTGLFTTISPVGPYSFRWYKNNILIPSVTSSNLPITVDDFGEYYVIATNSNTGCSGTSNRVTIMDSVSNTLFIFPNPSKGNFQVRYYNQGGANVDRTLNVFDERGAKVFSRKYTISGIYARMDVSLQNITGAGTYFVDLRDASGKRLANGKVVIQQ